MDLGSTQPLVKMSTRNIISWGKGGRCVELTTSPCSCTNVMEIWEPKPPGTLWATQNLFWDPFTLLHRVTSWLLRHVKNTARTISKTVISSRPSSTKTHKNRSGISTAAICNISVSFLLVGTTGLISSEPNCLIYQHCVILYNSPVTWQLLGHKISLLSTIHVYLTPENTVTHTFTFICVLV
jgi:hypothetical protein